MSDATAISAVTSLLHQLLETRLHEIDPAIQVTTKPLDKARSPTALVTQINLFLYQTTINAAYRNMDPPRQARPGETGFPALPLDLHYLVTAYGRADEDIDAHEVFGRSLAILHDTPLLSRANPIATAAGLDQQSENLRVTPAGVSLEEISKLWTAFQSQYRLSAVFCVSLVLIDSARPPRSPLPVLTRGRGDSGVTTQVGQVPLLTQVRPPKLMPGPELGQTLNLVGEHLDQAGMIALFRNFRLDAELELPAPAGPSPRELALALPTFDAGNPTDVFERWVPGPFSVRLRVIRRNPAVPDDPGVVFDPTNPDHAYAFVSWSSNEVFFNLAPSIAVAPSAADAAVAVGDIVSVSCTPNIRASQRVLLLFADRQLVPLSVTAAANVGDASLLTFEVPNLPSGDYPVRLRVDGADSSPARVSPINGQPEFDPARTVRIA